MAAILFNFENSKTKEYLASIGGIVVCLNHLEHFIEFMIWELINPKVDNANKSQLIGERITVNLEYIEKLELLRSLIIERKGIEKAEEFKEIYIKCKKACEIRNDISHSLWSIEFGNNKEGISPSTTKTNMQKAFQRGKNFDFLSAYKQVNLDELKLEMNQINQTISDLFSFFM
ncbi:MAG: hypothetical protein PHE32_03775 [Candidatus Shapirobacteria bacterium]|nr:hypothetical protein [Candidatus Shapirobacteria bacterium]MDD4410794.1 hypothetical protein [Candidatus Shapirobacteria bacterium]